MAIIQENMAEQPRKEVRRTAYGADYVEVATETPVEVVVSSSSEKEEEKPAVVAAPVVDEKPVEAISEPSVGMGEPKVAKRKGGRPKKSQKKGK